MMAGLAGRDFRLRSHAQYAAHAFGEDRLVGDESAQGLDFGLAREKRLAPAFFCKLLPKQLVITGEIFGNCRGNDLGELNRRERLCELQQATRDDVPSVLRRLNDFRQTDR